MRKIRLLYLLPLAAMVMSGCSVEDLMFWKKKSNEPEQQEEQKQDDQQQQAKSFEGLSLANATFTFDGQAHSISVAGTLPEGATVSYGEAGNSFTAVGIHPVIAVVHCEGYNDLTLNATLTIVAADFAGLSLEDLTVDYDGEEHKIEVAGNLPEGATVSYGEAGNAKTEPGVYTVTATVSKEGYNTTTLTATLTINKLNFEGIVFEDAEYEYTGEEREIVATVPQKYLDAGAVLTYSKEGNKFSAAGWHFVTATVKLEHYNDFEKTAVLKIGNAGVATNRLMVEDFEGLDDNELGEEFEFRRYDTNTSSWVAPEVANISLASNEEIGAGSKTMKMSISHQGYAFKATKALRPDTDACKKFTGFAFDTLMDDRAPTGKMKVEVQIWLKDMPLPEAAKDYRTTWVTYTVSTDAPSIWTHWEIPFDDDTFTIAYSKDHTESANAVSALGMTIADMTPYIDEIAIIVNPSATGEYEQCFAYIDNFELTQGTEKSVEKYIRGGRYVDIKDEETVLFFDLNENLTSGAFLVNGIEASKLTIEKEGSKVTAKDVQYSGNGLTVVADINDDGSLTVSSVSGQAQETFSYLSGQTFSKFANVKYDFQELERKDGTNKDTNWSRGYYGENGLVDVPVSTNLMYIKNFGDNNLGNMYMHGAVTYQYTYMNDMIMGLADRFSVGLTNDRSGTHDINLKIVLSGAKGEKIFVAGSESEYAVIEAGTGNRTTGTFELYSKEFTEMNIKAITFVVQTTGTGDDYLYFDNLRLFHTMPDVIPEVSSVSLSENSKELDLYGVYEFDLSANVIGTHTPPQKVTWSSNAEDVATVDQNGHVVGLKTGTAKITATSDYDKTKKAICTVTVVDTTPQATYINYYLYNDASDAYVLQVTDTNDAARIKKVGGDAAEFSAALVESTLTLTHSSGAAVLQITATVLSSSEIKITALSGAGAALYEIPLLNKSFTRMDDVTLGFDDGTEGNKYTNAHWSQQRWGGSAYAPTSLDMNCRAKNGNKNVNLPCNGTGNLYVYSHDTVMGLVNHIEIDLGNYFNSNVIQYKIVILDSNLNMTYATANGADSYVNLASNSDYQHISLDFAITYAAHFGIFVKNGGTQSYLYIDNVAIGYRA